MWKVTASHGPDVPLSLELPSPYRGSREEDLYRFNPSTALDKSVGRTGPELRGPPEVTIVLATINERENLTCLLGQIRSLAGPEPELVIIDDGSLDGTREVILSAAQMDPRVRYVFNGAPRTIVGAHLQGIALSSTEYIIFMDSDLQHPADLIPPILNRLKQGYDVVVASRYKLGGSSGTRSPLRGLISRVATVMARLAVQNARGLSDPVSGFFGVRREIFGPLDGALRGFETLLFVLAAADNPKVAEIPYCFRERGKGDSKVLRGWTFVRVFLAQLLAAKRLEQGIRRTNRGATSRKPSRTNAD